MKIVKNEYSKRMIANYVAGFKLKKILINNRVFDDINTAYEFVDSIPEGDSIDVDVVYDTIMWNVLN